MFPDIVAADKEAEAEFNRQRTPCAHALFSALCRGEGGVAGGARAQHNPIELAFKCCPSWNRWVEARRNPGGHRH